MIFNKDSDKYYFLVELLYYSVWADRKMLEQVLWQDRMQGVSPEEADMNGQTPLMAAVTAENYDTTLLLVQYGANTADCLSRQLRRCGHFAAEWGRPKPAAAR